MDMLKEDCRRFVNLTVPPPLPKTLPAGFEASRLSVDMQRSNQFLLLPDARASPLVNEREREGGGGGES